MPAPGLTDYGSVPGVPVNFFLHLVTSYNTGAVPFIYSEKAAWTAKEIATVLPQYF